MYSLSSRDYFFLIFKGKLPKGNNPGFIAHHFFTEDTFSLMETKLSVASRYNLLPDTLVTFIKETRVNGLIRGTYWNPYGCTHPGKDCRDISDKRLASNILDAIFAVIGESALLSLGMFNKKFKICLKPIFYYEKVSKFRISKNPKILQIIFNINYVSSL